ncbi:MULTISPECIES: pyruvate dehydrogenase (acetyl-transferring) E1 component subunit alpha [unclassified Microbacterium]|uniref:pyruvate dehydrogenase (acetyl-transferring) E1 component subunit alpha n=1 Tax=unclassified Microbacterium TaxID=2609290 RepID=UPI00386BDD7F
MTDTLTSAASRSTDTDDVARLLDHDGNRVADERLDPWVADVDAAMLRQLYRDMALTRRLDAEGVALQRQGHLGLWAPAQGQEAVQIGTAWACHDDDFLFPSYREIGIELVRGVTPADFVMVWHGAQHSTYDPYAVHVANPQIIIGAQSLHAVGYAMGIQRDGGDQIAAAYFGDGASSQGDVNEAMIFASSYSSPVVFVCSNNQWAISEPVTVQSRYPIAGRAPGFGIPSMRVDGNDVLACVAAMRWAADHARSGRGPAFLEAVTYRVGPHTTSDDPTRYRDAAEVEYWRARDPLTRVETYLRRGGAFDDAFLDGVRADADRFTAAMRAAVVDAAPPAPLSMFDHVYAEPHIGVEEERAATAAYLSGFAPAEDRS